MSLSSNISILKLPREVLVRIFSNYVEAEGIGKFLRLVAPASSVFEAISFNPGLWRVVDDESLPMIHLFRATSQGTLCCTVRLNLSYLSNRLPEEEIVSIILQCPRLKWLDLSNSRLSKMFYIFLAENCENLDSITLKSIARDRDDFIDDLIEPVLERCGRRLSFLDLSTNCFVNSENILERIAETCHSLKELRVSDIRGGMLQCPIGKLQKGCPKLKVLELGCCDYTCAGASESNGFRFLEVFVTGGVDGKGPRDRHLNMLLKESRNLKVLDIRGCDVTCECILRIPSGSIEKLYVSQTLASRSVYLYRVIAKWKNSLKVLDLSGVLDRNSISVAISTLLSNPNPLIENLDLSYSNISPLLINMLLENCHMLRYLNVRSNKEAVECVNKIGNVEICSDC